MFDRKLASGYADIKKLYETEFKGYFKFAAIYSTVMHVYEQEFPYLVPSLDELLLQQPSIKAKQIVENRTDLTNILQRLTELSNAVQNL